MIRDPVTPVPARRARLPRHHRRPGRPLSALRLPGGAQRAPTSALVGREVPADQPEARAARTRFAPISTQGVAAAARTTVCQPRVPGPSRACRVADSVRGSDDRRIQLTAAQAWLSLRARITWRAQHGQPPAAPGTGETVGQPPPALVSGSAGLGVSGACPTGVRNVGQGKPHPCPDRPRTRRPVPRSRAPVHHGSHVKKAPAWSPVADGPLD